MNNLFTDSSERMMKFVFNFYDFDKDGNISKEDIRTVISYIPLNTQAKLNSNKLKYEV